MAFRGHPYRPDPDSYFVVKAQSGTFRIHGAGRMSALEEMCDRTRREPSVILGVEERHKGDDPESDPPLRRISRTELAEICSDYWP